MKNFYTLLKKYWGGGFILLFLSTPSVFAQTGFTLSWDSEVGCLEYSQDRKNNIPLEDIDDDECILVCEGSVVKFNLIYDEQLQNVDSINWEADGGDIIGPTNGSTIKIKWPHPYDHGSVTVHIVMENGEEIYSSLCINVKQKPKAKFETLTEKNRFYCSHTDIHFKNLSEAFSGTQIVSNHWDFGDGNFSNASDPAHSYDQPGTYTVVLTVYDECNCSSTYKKDITVLKPGLEISCPTVTCEGATETYTVVGTPYTNGEVRCGKYLWQVEGGHITEQGNDWVDVLWDDVGEDGFGYIYFDQSSCDVACQNILAAKIPVVANEGTIQGGKHELCQNDQSRYTLPQWPTTDFEWTVYDGSGTTYPDATVLVDQRNEIAIDASNLPAGYYTLRSDYTNTLLQCGGSAEYRFSVFDNLEIGEHPNNICEGDAFEFSLNSSVSNTTWEVTKGGSQVAQGSGSIFNYLFNGTGHFTITATAPGYCKDVTSVNVYEIPSVANAEIQGPNDICPGQGEEFVFDGDTNGFDIVWTVDHGEFLGPDMGETVSIKFDEGYTFYEVSAYLSNPDYNGCISDDVLKTVKKFTPDVQIVNLANNSSEGPQTFCSSLPAQFILDYSSDDYLWSVTPNKLGQVSEDTQGTDAPTILFNEPYTDENDNLVQDGTLYVEARVCGKMEVVDSFDFSLIQAPGLTITDAPNEICPGENFDIDVASSFPLDVATPQNDMTLTFYENNDQVAQLVNGGVQNNPTSFSFQNIELANPDNNQTLTYVIEIANDNCHDGTVTGSITVKPAPEVQISIDNGGTVFCQSSQINTVLTASVQGNYNTSSFQWYYNDDTAIPSPIGTGSTLDLTNWSQADFGKYTVEVSNNIGCTSVSNDIRIHKDCGSYPPGCNLSETVNLNAIWDECEVIKLTGDYTTDGGINPNNFTWLTESDFTDENVSLLSDPSNTQRYYKPKAAGKYYFAYKVSYGEGCVFTALDSVVVGYHIDLEKEITCEGNDYKVTMLNESTYYDDFDGNTTITYKITNLTTGITETFDSQDDLEASATLGEGEYELKLQLERGNYPTCTVTDTIQLTKPNAQFSVNPTQYCAEESVLLTPDHPMPGASYLWEWQGKTNTAETLRPNFDKQTNAEIKLTITGRYGCSDSHTLNGIDIKKADFNGKIQPENPAVCEGGSVNLGYMPSGIPSGFKWYHNGNAIQNANTANITVNDPGLYTVSLFDENGCVYSGISGVYVNIAGPPILTAMARGQICEGEDFNITGTLSPDDAEYRVYQIGSGGNTLVQDWLPGPEVDFTTTPASPGDYAYLVEYKDVHTGCDDTEAFNTTVLPSTSITADYEILGCDPYKVRVYISNAPNDPGLFTWSNGQHGDEIIVDHGGPYRVRFQPQSDACAARASVDVPKSAERYAWIFPDGCFEYCPSKTKVFPYIIGPIPEFNGYKWELDGNIQSGNGQVDDFVVVSQEGKLSLTLTNENCDFTTDILNLTRGEKCKDDCRLDLKIEKAVVTKEGPFLAYHIYGAIFNNYGFPVTVQLSSPNGTFIPASISIPANGMYDFNGTPITFIPDNGFTGGSPSLTITAFHQNRVVCSDFKYLQLPSLTGRSGRVDLSVSPNPFRNHTEVAYKVSNIQDFTKGVIKLFSLNGVLMEKRTVRKAQGNERFEIGNLASGTYILVFYHQEKKIGQKILIKE